MERLFILQRNRFCIGQPYVYVLQGYFMGNSIAGSRLRAFLDGQELEVGTSVREGIVVRQKYMTQAPASGYIDREYDVWITLPKDFMECSRLEVYQYQSDEKKRIHSIPTAALQKKQRELESYLESWREERGKICAGGWAAGNEPCCIRVTDDNGNGIPSEIKWHYREDVRSGFPELEECGMDISVPEQMGFEVTFARPGSGHVKILLQAGEQKAIYRVSVKRGAKMTGTPSLWQKGTAYFKRNGLKRTAKRCAEKLFLGGNSAGENYMKWRKKRIPSGEELASQKKTVFPYQPLFSIVVPLYRTPQNYLKELIDSVENQTYRNWELCLSDGSGADSPLKGFLNEVQKNRRIKVACPGRQMAISENTNEALKMAEGDFIVFADHDDLISPDALFECAKVINEQPDIDMIYTDEDKVTMNGKEFFQPHFKPDFNIDLLRSMNYFCHLVAVKRNLFEKAGYLNPEFDGAQDYDFVLRCTEQAQHICHIPKVLYHWRAHKDSTAENPESKRYAFTAGKRAIQAHYDRLGIKAVVEEGEYPGLYRTRYLFEEYPPVSVIIPNKDHSEDLRKCIDSVRNKSAYPNLEFIIVENNSTEDATFVCYKEMEAEYPNVHVVYWAEEFNYSKINNFGVDHAKGEYLLFLNNDIEMINEDCIEELLGPCMREDVGAVGARLFYPDDTIQHAGVIIGFGGIAGHAFIGKGRTENGYFSRIICAADLSAVTAACMMVKRSVFEEAGGFDETLRVAFNDIDLCLKIRSCNKLVVYNPYAQLYHYESKSRGYEDTPEKVARFNREADLFLKKWPDILEKGDPAYNPNLTLNKSDFSLRV